MIYRESNVRFGTIPNVGSCEGAGTVKPDVRTVWFTAFNRCRGTVAYGGTGMDHSTNHPKFSHDTLIRTLRYLTGTYYMTRYLIYYKGFMISYKMRPWRQIRVSLEEVTVPTQRTTHKREFCHIRHILVTSLEAGSGFLLRTLKLVPPESDNAAKPCISPLVGTVLFLGRGGFSLASRVIF